MLNCRSETVIEYKQRRYDKTDEQTRKDLFDAGFLPSLDWQNRAFVVWDVECLMDQVKDAHNRDISPHRLATIGLAMSLKPDEMLETAFLYRNSMEPESLKSLIKEFWHKMQEFKKKMVENLPKEILVGLNALTMFKKTQAYQSLCPNEKTKIGRQILFLKNSTLLKSYSWNGAPLSNY